MSAPTIVRVTFEDEGRSYVYRDPGLGLRFGDRVEVPWGPFRATGVVIGFGRRGYDGPIRDVYVRLEEAE